MSESLRIAGKSKSTDIFENSFLVSLETIHDIFHNITPWYTYFNTKTSSVFKRYTHRKSVSNDQSWKEHHFLSATKESPDSTLSPSFSDSLFPKDSPGVALPKPCQQQLLLPITAIANWHVSLGSLFSSYTWAMTLFKHEQFLHLPQFECWHPFLLTCLVLWVH